MLHALCLSLAVAALPDSLTASAEERPNEALSPSRRIAFFVSLATTPMAPATVGSIGLISISPQSTLPRLGLAFEARLFEQWSMELTVEGSYAGSGFAGLWQNLELSARPGLRWYPSGALKGGFVGVQLPFGWSRTVFGEFGSSSAWTGGATLLGGWCFTWDNGFIVSAAAGPSVVVQRNELPGSTALWGTAVGLRAQLAAGFSL